MTDPVAGFHADAFAPHLDTQFEVKGDGGSVSVLALTQVVEYEQPGHELFSLVFRGEAASYLGQGMRSLRHEALGEFALFLVPVAQDGPDAILYEAAFNRLVATPQEA